MPTAKCSKCGKEFSNEHGLRVHTSRMHKAGKTQEPAPKRAYNKKKKTEVSVNYCPTCGCNLHAVAMGIAIANK